MILKPIFAQFEIDERCTHQCIHCYNYYSGNRSSAFASPEIADFIVKSELFFITITGGEPLMAGKILFDAVKKFKKANMDVSLNSNLHLLKKEDAETFNDLGLNYVLSSILGPNENIHDEITQNKGSFKKLLKSLDYLVNAEVNVSLNMVVSQKNLREVYETGKFVFDQFGIRKFSATPLVPSPQRGYNSLMLSREEYISALNDLLRLENDFGIIPDSLHPALPCMFEDKERNKYKRFFEKRGCAAGKGAVTFSTSGDVRVCSHERRVYGNILRNPLEEIVGNMREWLNKSFVPEECASCIYLNRCNGGCRVSAEAMTGKLNGPDPYFTKPIKEIIPISQPEKKVENITAIKGNIRYREDNPEIITIYVNPSVSARLNQLEFEVFKRFVAGRTYDNISRELGNKYSAKEISKSLIRKGLLV